MVLDFQALRRTRMHSWPYAWATVENFIRPAQALQLSREFPDTGFSLTRRDRGTDKMYVVASRTVVALGAGRCDGAPLSNLWEHLVLALMSAEYREVLTDVTGIDIRGDLMEIGLYRYAAGGFVSPHCDKRGKSIGQILYFNTNWRPEWGGAFRILSGPSEDVVCQEIWPTTGSSLILTRSETSWHCVSAVTGPEERLAVHVDFWHTHPGYAEGREQIGLT